jgi:hypothetical protein
MDAPRHGPWMLLRAAYMKKRRAMGGQYDQTAAVGGL